MSPRPCPPATSGQEVHAVPRGPSEGGEDLAGQTAQEGWRTLKKAGRWAANSWKD